MVTDHRQPVCSTCDDTHRMTLGDREVMCTRCPLPCRKCRRGGTGAFCETTPCACSCHDRAAKSSPVTDPELSLYGAGDTIADRLAREVRELRAQRAASRERVVAVVREAIDHSRHLPHGQAEGAIATRVADAIAAPQRTLDSARVRDVVREAALQLMRPTDEDAAAQWRRVDAIAARAAEQLDGQAVALSADEDRDLIRAIRLDLIGAVAITEWSRHVALLDRLLSTPSQVASPAAAEVAEPQPGPAVRRVPTVEQTLERFSAVMAGLAEVERAEIQAAIHDNRVGSEAHDGLKGMRAERDAARSARLVAEMELRDVNAELDAARAECERLRSEVTTHRDCHDVTAAERDAEQAECERLRKHSAVQQAYIDTHLRDHQAATEQVDSIRSACADQAVQLSGLRDRIRALLATDPVVSEEWIREAVDLDRSGIPLTRQLGQRVIAESLLAAARQLHELRAGLREIVGGELAPRAWAVTPERVEALRWAEFAARMMLTEKPRSELAEMLAEVNGDLHTEAPNDGR